MDNLVIDLLVDDNFINYIMNPTSSLIRRWERYFKENPEYAQVEYKARMILLGEYERKTLTSIEVKEIELKVLKTCGFILFD